MTTQIQVLHQMREGLDNQKVTYCGAVAVSPAHLAECSYPNARCNCKEVVDCVACATEKKARKLSQAKTAQAVIKAQEEKMQQFGDCEIYD